MGSHKDAALPHKHSKGGGKSLPSFSEKNHVAAKIFCFQHSMKDMDTNKNEDTNVNISIHSIDDLRLSLLCNWFTIEKIDDS